MFGAAKYSSGLRRGDGPGEGPVRLGPSIEDLGLPELEGAF